MRSINYAGYDFIFLKLLPNLYSLALIKNEKIGHLLGFGTKESLIVRACEMIDKGEI